MRIGLDILGGDFAPDATVKGAILAQKELPAEVQLVLIGDKDKIVEICNAQNFDYNKFEIVHTTDCITMADHPAKAFSAKPDSSIALGFKLLYANKIDGFASAGNTGAMLVGAMYTIKSIPGVIRPCISTEMPQLGETPSLLLDVGINPDCRPDVLYQYGVLGSVYARQLYGVENPKVALLNIGEEDQKGNLVAKSTFELMKDSKDFNFIGNVEGNQLFGHCPADVVVCDGFTGNIVLKEAEGFYELIKKRNISDEFFDRFNSESYGGTPILGVNAPVIIGHGASNDIAIRNMVMKTKSVIEAEVCEIIKDLYK